jgi:uncharacterized membrane protein
VLWWQQQLTVDGMQSQVLQYGHQGMDVLLLLLLLLLLLCSASQDHQMAAVVHRQAGMGR